MRPEELLPIEKWAELEKKIAEKTELSASVFDIDGIRIIENIKWSNKLCPVIKATDKGQSFICAVAHMNLAIIAKNTGKPVIEECDAGLVKMVVPIFSENEFIGAVGACGLLLDDGEVDTFSVNKITEIQEEKIEALAKDIPVISSKKMNELADYIKRFINSELQH